MRWTDGRKSLTKLVGGLFCLFLSIDHLRAEPVKWLGDIDASARFAAGSSREVAWELDTELERRAGTQRTTLQVEVRHENESTAGTPLRRVKDRYLISPKFEWWDAPERHFVFLDPEYKADQLSSTQSRASWTAGVGVGGMKVGAGELRFETGLGMRQSNYRDGTRKRAPLWVVRNRLDYPLTDALDAFQTLQLERSGREERIEAEVGLKQALSEHLSLRARLTLTYSRPIDATERHLDTESRLSLGYTF
ncbi:DUF481 domain-containing protein [Chitinimonas sp. PSY-7]|uniref:DUF481 domain-containing protein n=1 Tax=Chitinimonas sp. PSY-7 TaxID=3459088 RepID=UPI00403FFD9A